MANAQAMLEKIARSIRNMGISETHDSLSIVADGLIISLVDASIQSPMGGVSPASSPFLGIGIAAPKIIKIKGAAGENSIAAILADASAAMILAVCAHMANDIVIEAGDTSAELARIPGHSDIQSLGQ